MGCRKRSAKKGLVRLVLVDSKLVVDEDAKQDGRGAYVHQSQECFQLATSRNAFDRSFRTKVALDDVQNFFRP